MTVRVQQGAFDAGAEITALYARDHSVGAVASFVGTVREATPGDGLTLTLEHYPGMTEEALGAIVGEARVRFRVIDATVIHRVGLLAAGEAIVFVGVAAVHRGAAFQACEFIMDYLKTRAPFWKKESAGGVSHWVDARSSDDAAAARWEPPAS